MSGGLDLAGLAIDQETEQAIATVRGVAQAIAAYYAALIDGKVPKALAAQLTIEYHSAQLMIAAAKHGVNVTYGIGGEE